MIKNKTRVQILIPGTMIHDKIWFTMILLTRPITKSHYDLQTNHNIIQQWHLYLPTMHLQLKKIEYFTITTLLQFYNDDFYNTDFWHDLILDLTLLWTLAAAEVLLCLFQVMVLWRCIVLLVYVWVVLLCPPSCTCINEQDPNQYTNKILTQSCKPYVREIFKIQM